LTGLDHDRTNDAGRAGSAEPATAARELIVNRTPFLLTRCRRDLTYLFVSRAYAEMFGREPEQIIGRRMPEILGEEAFRTLEPFIARVLEGERVEYECEVPLARIGRRVMSGVYTPEKDERGEVKGWLGSLIDVTERAHAEARLAADLEAMTLLQELGSSCTREGEDIDKCLDAVVAAAIAIAGAQKGAVQLLDSGTNALTVAAQRGFDEPFLNFFARVRTDSRASAAASLRTGKRVVVEDVTTSEIFAGQPSLQVLLDAGVRAVQSTPMIGTDGNVLGVITTHFATPTRPSERALGFLELLARQAADYLNRVRAEGALRRLHESLEAEVETRTRERDRIWSVSEDLLGVSNFAGYFVSINPAWTKTLGWSEAEIKAMHVSELRHPDDAPHSLAGREQLARGVPTVRMENRFRHKDGSWRWIAWTMTAEEGLIYVAGRHVTAEKEAAAALARAHQQLANAQKMEALGQLTGGVAHDFNNLMMIVGGYAQSLKSRLVEPKNVRALQAIQAAVQRGEGLTRQLLSFSRRLPLSPIVVHPADAIEAIRDVIAGSTHVNIDLSIDIPQETWPIRVDRSELALALVNIAINARDAMPSGGRLSISSANVTLQPADTPDELSGDFVALTIADTGIGIPADVLPRVFEPFFTTKGADKGTGLGLSQVYGFARRSGGSVILTSEVGKGTKVAIYLPRSHAQVAARTAEQGAAPLGRQETILVVEDNGDVRLVAVSLLEQLGYRTIEAECAADALQLLAESAGVDLVFTDVILPGEMDGLALAHTIRARHPQLPIVLTTGYARSLDADPGFAVLRKPYEISALSHVIRAAIDAGGSTDGDAQGGQKPAMPSFARSAQVP
jgi:PAS domain S-box-containing protein